MSLEVYDNDIIRKFESESGSSANSHTVHEHAERALLDVYILKDSGKKDSHGNIIYERTLMDLNEILPKSHIINPAQFTNFWEYINWYETAFKRIGKSHLKEIPFKYALSMIAIDRKSRGEFTQVATGAALNAQVAEQAANIQKVRDQ